ncbi:MAG TPA: hypothetical protein DCY13_11380 [Verrucomicrobiales bacterium]|nr:hypothetical protein [Verrucomicrobiales bacterium]
MNLRRATWPAIVFTALLAAMTQSAHACATCFGKSDSKLAEGMNWGIFTLLAVVFLVLAGISAFFIFIAWRSASRKSSLRHVS